jgi:hypothetical protein
MLVHNSLCRLESIRFAKIGCVSESVYVCIRQVHYCFQKCCSTSLASIKPVVRYMRYLIFLDIKATYEVSALIVMCVLLERVCMSVIQKIRYDIYVHLFE